MNSLQRTSTLGKRPAAERPAADDDDDVIFMGISYSVPNANKKPKVTVAEEPKVTVAEEPKVTVVEEPKVTVAEEPKVTEGTFADALKHCLLKMVRLAIFLKGWIV